MKKNNLLLLFLAIGSLISFYIITATTLPIANKLLYLHELEQVRYPNNNIFSKLISTGNTIAIFYEDWCPPCKRMTPILEELADEMPHITFVKVKREFYRSMFDQYKLNTVPALLFFRNGQLIKIRPQSATKNELKALIKKIYSH